MPPPRPFYNAICRVVGCGFSGAGRRYSARVRERTVRVPRLGLWRLAGVDTATGIGLRWGAGRPRGAARRPTRAGGPRYVRPAAGVLRRRPPRGEGPRLNVVCVSGARVPRAPRVLRRSWDSLGSSRSSRLHRPGGPRPGRVGSAGGARVGGAMRGEWGARRRRGGPGRLCARLRGARVCCMLRRGPWRFVDSVVKQGPVHTRPVTCTCF